jgi:hypothetical protein
VTVVTTAETELRDVDERRPVRVFISYAHESAAHVEAVTFARARGGIRRALAMRLEPETPCLNCDRCGHERCVTLLLSTVVMASAALGGYQLSGDAQGQATLAWTGFAGERKVVRVADVRDGHPGRATELWSGKYPTNGTLESFDVSPGGAAVACVRVSAGPTRQWRLRVLRRPPGGAWSKPILVRATNVTEPACATDDAGQVTLTWGLGGPIKAASIAADGRLDGPVTIAPRSVGSPQLAVSAAGAATIAYTVGEKNRALYIPDHRAAQHAERGGRQPAR